jgi:hypothetical protein
MTTDQEYTDMRAILAEVEKVKDPVEFTMTRCIYNHSHVAEISGLSGTTLRAIRDGKKRQKHSLPL